MNDELAASIRLVGNQSWLKGICGYKQFQRLLDLGIYGWFRPYAGAIEPTMNAISCGDINSTSRLYPLLSCLPSPFSSICYK